MTNKELFYNFQIIENENDNIFDKYCALAKLEEEYKTTEFAKQFGDITIIEAYNLYIKDTTSIGTLLRDFKNVDLPNIFTMITDKLDVSKTFENIDPNTADLMKTLLEQFKF
jgi:hypothetical protein